MIHFTSDTHFGDDNLIENTRSFSSTEDHDSTLLYELNKHVARNDTLVILGDFGKVPGRYRYRQQINCKQIHFITGNHDSEVKIRRVFGGNVWQQRMIKGQIENNRYFCCHYPMAYWDHSHFSVIHCHGHLHDSANREAAMDLAFPGRRSLDVGVDAAKRILGEYRPFSEQEILDLVGDRSGHDEVWRDVVGYEDSYQVSCLGNVRSKDRHIAYPVNLRFRKGQNLNPGIHAGGYRTVKLCKDGKKKTHTVHRLVLAAFVGPCPKGPESLHGTAGSTANWLSNLKYGTPKENYQDQIRDGVTGQKAVIRSDGKRYNSQVEAAKDVGCSKGNISNVCCGKSNTAGGFGWKFDNGNSTEETNETK